MQHLVKLLVAMGFLTQFLFGFNASSTISVDTAKIQSVLDSKWQVYADKNMKGHGAIGIYITSPKGNYFFNSGLTKSTITKDAHFRSASTTKTFTAAAVMLLHQQGKHKVQG